MSEFYPIVTIEPEWVFGDEDMGSKEKFWYFPREGETPWLFKYPQEGTGQHWAEKIAAEVADRLRILHAKVELAEFQNVRGSVTESFARGGRVLIHGNELLAMMMSDYNPEMKFHQSAHTLEHIWQALEPVSRTSNKQTQRLFAEYIVLDAVIGNTDRHHENWGLQLRQRGENHWDISLAPSFDHASSLGRELRDEKRDRFMAEDRIGHYAEKGRGGIYWSVDERWGPSPLALVRQAAHKCPDLFRPALAKLNKLDEGSLRNVIDRVPSDWMSPSARKFAMALICYNLEQLRKLDT